MVLKLHYFNLAGRAEATRIILSIGKVPFEDVTFEFADWPKLKPKMPLGQVPVLELDDGQMLAQSGAIERYTAKLAGLYPKDPLVAAKADQASFLLLDLWEPISATFQLATTEEKIKARQELLAGKAKDKLLLLQKLLENQQYFAGSELSYADIQVFASLGNLTNGIVDGVPATLLDEYPGLKAHFQRIANLEAVKARYANATGTRVVFKAK